MRRNFVRRLVAWGLVLGAAGAAVACSSHGDAKDLMIIPEQAKMPQPSTMDSVTPCDPAHPSYDLCGVHGNSGIGNRPWSLMTLGGSHAITNIGVDSPLGFPASHVLWYETFTRLRPQATMSEAALSQNTWTAKYDAAHLTTVAVRAQPGMVPIPIVTYLVATAKDQVEVFRSMEDLRARLAPIDTLADVERIGGCGRALKTPGGWELTKTINGGGGCDCTAQGWERLSVPEAGVVQPLDQHAVNRNATCSPVAVPRGSSANRRPPSASDRGSRNERGAAETTKSAMRM